LSSEHNTNFDTLYTLANGNIDNANIKTGAGIIYSKLVLTNSIVLADLASAIKSGSDATLITGTAGTDSYVAKWNADGDLVDGYAFIDDDTMATATSTNVSSSESVKAYVDTEISNIPSDAFSNVVFSWSGEISEENPSYIEKLWFRFKKISGVSTVTIQAYMKSTIVTIGSLSVDIGGQTGTVTPSSVSSSYSWVTSSDINVSGLTNGTVYDGVVKIKHGSSVSLPDGTFCSAITLIVS